MLSLGGTNVAVASVHNAGLIMLVAGIGQYRHTELWHLCIVVHIV